MDLQGAIDLHVHTSPCLFERKLDDYGAVEQARAAGMRALVLKSHHTLTADRAELVASHSSPRFDVFGGLALNLMVGGLNPVAVETALGFGARQIWMPTMHARNCLERAQLPAFRAEAARGRTGLSVRRPEGGLTPETLIIIEQVRDAGVILGTGHLAPDESLELLEQAHAMGARRLLVTHPLMHFTLFSTDQMRRAQQLGAYLELVYLSCSPGFPEPTTLDTAAQVIRELGPDRIVLGSDGGQASNPPPAEMLYTFAVELLQRGVERRALEVMMKDNPAFLLDL